MGNWRNMTWVILAWTGLIVAGIFYAGYLFNDNTEKCGQDAVCKVAAENAAGSDITFVGVAGFMGFVVLSIVWFMTRPQPQTDQVVSSR